MKVVLNWMYDPRTELMIRLLCSLRPDASNSSVL
jgi:hypothetical protein